MKKRGFTLVELLAVIIVLSIIALIATPMILGTIDDSERGSFEQGIKNIVKAARTYQVREEIDDNISECRYFSFDNDVSEVTVRDGKTYYPLKDLSLKGTLPTQGEVKVCAEEITMEVSDGSYSGKYDNEQINIGKGDLADNDLSTPIIDIFNVSTTTDKIMIAISAHSPSVGGTIVNYYYKIDDGDYIKTTNPSYTFEKLTPGKEYIISVKVENKSGIINEKSKTVTTKKFGELTIEVADMGKWTSSKKVTIKSSTQGSTIEYNIIRYNEETSQEQEKGYTEYTEPFTLSTLATEEHPTTLVARYNDNGVYSEEKTYVITKIDPTAPTNTSPSVVVSTTKPTSEANVVIRQADSESGLNQATIEYGYSMSQNGTYTWQTSSKLIKLEAGKTYYVKTRVTNNAGLTTESVAQSYQVGSISTCSVNILTSGWATSKDVKIVGSQTGAELQYQIGTTDADKWINIENDGVLNIKENTTVYCRLWDGTTENVGQGIINKIDKTSPELTLGTVTTTTNSAAISFAAVDNESQIKTTTCKYSSTSGNYTTDGTINGNTCNLNDLATGTTYYYQICVANNAGNPEVCETGSTNPAEMTKPSIGFTNTPSSIQNGYLKQQIATVSYVSTGVTSPRYFVKTSRAATSSVAVTNSCGTGTNPTANCTGITSTTSLAADTWYEVSGNVNVTYDVASDSNATIYATTYDGTNFSGNISGTVAKIDRTSPELTLRTATATTNSVVVPFSATDSQSGIATTTCKYSSTSGSYTTDGTISGSTCTLNGLVTGTTYYYQICTTDKVNNTATCKEESTNPVEIAKPSIDFNNTPATIQNGYLKQQVATVSYVSTGVTSPRYFVKTSRAATSSVAVTNSCGTGTNPTANCTGITSTTSLAADTWYEVSGNVNVTYNSSASTTATLYATTYDGTNFSGNISGTVAKIDRTIPELTLGTATATTNSVVIPFSATDSQSGVGSTTCKYSSTDGSYTTDGTISDSTCNLNSLTSGTTYYYQICVTDKVNNTATCKPGSTNSIVMEKPSITSVNTPALPVNGYLKQQVNQVKYVSTGITNPRYFVKTTRAATSSVAVTKSCGTGTNPTISCTGITSTTSLAADTWYEVSGNVNVTYNSSASTTATLYATTYDGTNFSGNISSTIPKIDPNAPTLPTVSLKLNDSTGSTYSSNTWTNQNVYHIVNSSDSESGIAYYQYSHNGSTNWSNDIDSLGWSSSYNSDKSQLEYLIDWGGSWDFYVRAVDYVGNVSANSAKFTVKIDKSAPVLSDLSNPSGDNWSNKAFNVTIKVAESGSGIAKCQYKYAYDQYGACNDKWCDDNSSAVSDGVYTGSFTANRNTTSYFRCFDNAGNVSNEMSTPIKIDTTAPSSTAPTVTQSSSNARSLVVTNKQTDGESQLNQSTLQYGYSTSSNGTYTWQSSNTFGSLTAGTTYYFKTKVKNNAGTETISNAASGKIAYTGIAAGTYSAGSSVKYAGVDWLVIKDNGNNVTLISKSNIGTGAYHTTASSDYGTSKAKTTIDNWFNNNSTLVNDKNVLALVADSSTGYYVRLPRSNELSTNIPNSSGTPFWTMSSYSSYQMIAALKNGTSTYYKTSGTVYARDIISTNGNASLEIAAPDVKEVDLIPASYAFTSLRVSGASATISTDKYYSSNKTNGELFDYASVCDATFGVTRLTISTVGYYPNGDSTCKKYSTVYQSDYVDYGVLGYRPVITVKEK